MGLLPLRWWASYDAMRMSKPSHHEEAPPQPEPLVGKRRGKRSAKRGDAGYFPGPV